MLENEVSISAEQRDSKGSKVDTSSTNPKLDDCPIDDPSEDPLQLLESHLRQVVPEEEARCLESHRRGARGFGCCWAEEMQSGFSLGSPMLKADSATGAQH